MKIATSVVAAMALAACGGSMGNGSTGNGNSPSQGPSSQSGNSQLAVSVTAPAATTDGGTAQQPVVISRIRASVASLKLESSADGGEQGEIHEGPFLIDLSAPNLGPNLQQVFAANVPAGNFRELDLDIAPSNSPAVGALANQNASIVVDGTFNGTPFTFVTAIDLEVKKEGNFTVGSGTSNVTLALDPAAWFGTAAAPLDPNVATNRAAIEARIRASLKAFRDDDRNGHDDDDVGDDRGGQQQDAGEPGDDHGGQQDAGQGGDDHGQHDGGDDHGGHDDGGH